MTIEIERAPARTEDFARLAAAIDELDRVGGERVGGPTREETAEESALWGRLAHLQPSALTDWQWLARQLARAVENGWSAEATAPLLRWAA